MRLRLAALPVVAALVAAGAARAAEPLPKQLEGVGVEEHLGRKLDLDIPFVDEHGKGTLLRDAFRDGRPVLLTLNYYRCKMLCNLQLNALTEALRGLSWTPGREFRVVTVTIDHREGPKLAAEKRKSHLTELGRGEVDWSFLIGTEANIRRLAHEVGFGFKYDKDLDQYAHPAVIQFLSPEGKLTRYIYGIDYQPRDLKFALIEASDGKVGTTVDRVILSCFHYDSSSGRYAPFALGIMRLGGVAHAAPARGAPGHPLGARSRRRSTRRDAGGIPPARGAGKEAPEARRRHVKTKRRFRDRCPAARPHLDARGWPRPAAERHDTLFYFILYISAIVVRPLVIGLTVLFAVKYRRRSEGQRTARSPETSRLEIVWSVIPARILAGASSSGASRASSTCRCRPATRSTSASPPRSGSGPSTTRRTASAPTSWWCRWAAR